MDARGRSCPRQSLPELLDSEVAPSPHNSTTQWLEKLKLAAFRILYKNIVRFRVLFYRSILIINNEKDLTTTKKHEQSPVYIIDAVSNRNLHRLPRKRGYLSVGPTFPVFPKVEDFGPLHHSRTPGLCGEIVKISSDILIPIEQSRKLSLKKFRIIWH